MSVRPRPVVIVGGGHNGLVAAAMLGRAGRDVLVLERRAAVGGAAVSDRPFAGRDVRLSRYAYLVSLFPRQLARDLGVRLRLADRSVAAYAPYVARDGAARGLLVEQDAGGEATRASFRDRTGSDAEHDAFRAFYAVSGAVAARLFPTFTQPLPTRREAEALISGVPGGWELFAGRPLGDSLDDRFDDDLVRGMVATDGLIGTLADLHEPSLRQNRCFLYHVVGSGDGQWRVPVGGMGAISAALAAAAAEAGADIRCGAEVLAVDGTEVTWRDGAGAEHAVSAGHVLANCAPAVLDDLRGRPQGPAPEPGPGSQLKVNLLLDRLPRLRSGDDPAVAFAGTFRLDESATELACAYAAAVRGELPDPLPAELYCHTLADPTIAGDGGPPVHTLTIFGLHVTPAMFRDEARARDQLVERMLDRLDEHLDEPIRDCVARDAAGDPCLEAKTPLDLERELALPGGNIFHGDLDWPWRAQDDPDRWGVATDHPRILRCGAGARRGGGVSGIAGHNAAMALLGR